MNPSALSMMFILCATEPEVVLHEVYVPERFLNGFELYSIRPAHRPSMNMSSLVCILSRFFFFPSIMPNDFRNDVIAGDPLEYAVPCMSICFPSTLICPPFSAS